MVLHEFLDAFDEQESPRTVCVGLRESVEAIWPSDQLVSAFGGYVVFAGEGGEEFLGVWGARNVKRFRRLLRERGADVALSRQRPYGLQMLRRSVLWPRPARPPAEA